MPFDNRKYKKTMSALSRGFTGETQEEQSARIKEEERLARIRAKEEAMKRFKEKDMNDGIVEPTTEEVYEPIFSEEERKRQKRVALKALEQAEKMREEDEDYMTLFGDR